MGCCVYINEEKKMNLNDFSKWLQYKSEKFKGVWILFVPTVYIYLYLSIYTHTHIYIYTHTHIYIYIYTHTHTHTHIHIYIYINWSPPCHAELRQQLKQKEPLPSIEYTYSNWTYFPEGQQFTKKFFLVLWIILICLYSEFGGFLLNVSQNHHN